MFELSGNKFCYDIKPIKTKVKTVTAYDLITAANQNLAALS